MRGFRRFLFTKWNSPTPLPRLWPWPYLLMVLAMSGCVSLVQPVGDWARPSDLGLHEKSLSGVKIEIRTGRLAKDGSVVERPLKIRTVLEEALKKIGAEIVDSRSEVQPDLTLWYLDRGVSESHSSYVSQFAFFFTGGVVPLVTSHEVGAELRVTDSRGALVAGQGAKLVDVQEFGWLALIHVFNFSETARTRKREVSKSFMRSVQNLVYSQAFHLRLAQSNGAPR